MENMNENKEGMSTEGQGMMAEKNRAWHWACCILPVVSLLSWLAAIFFVVLSWVSVASAEGIVWGYGPQWWIWNAVMFGILAIYGGRGKMIGCRGKAGCACMGGKCVCK